jgi:TonB family protein
MLLEFNQVFGVIKGVMMKLNGLFLVTLLVGCNSTIHKKVADVDINALDLTRDKSQAKNYWVVTKRSNPVYPTSAARNGISGCVEFSFVINKLGTAQNIQIIKSVPENTFNEAATRSLKQFKWVATQNNNLLQPVLTTLQIGFSTSPQQSVAECIVS